MNEDGPTDTDGATRRRLLRHVGSTAVLASLAGCGSVDEANISHPSPVAPASPLPPVAPASSLAELDDQYGSVVDLGRVGANTSGVSSVVSLLEEHAGDDTLLHLPKGRYLFDRMWAVDSFSNLGIHGNGAIIVPPDGYTDKPLLSLGGFGGSSDLRIDGLNFDFRDSETEPSPIFAFVEDGLRVTNVHVVGTGKRVRFEVMEAGGTGRVERLLLPDGGTDEVFDPGCFVSSHNRGELTFRDCYIARFPNNGLYASKSTGPVRVIGGTYENNDISNVRVGRDALVKSVTVRCVSPTRTPTNMRGVWAHGPRTVIDECEVYLKDVPVSDGGMVLKDSTTVRDSDIVVDGTDAAAIHGKDPDQSAAATAGRPTRDRSRFVGVQIDGDASGGSGVTVINHDGCLFDDVTIRQPGRNQDGIRFHHVNDAVVRRSHIEVGGEPIVLVDSTVSTPQTDL
ncbi:hypothetical protein [Haloarchaeobius sp. DFWS5]|uniref:hypothetical protein n=1 Tax=Haloarchaeobius sp. DFWS5 TaxID=3446114 RepID=UPI003EBB9CF9